MTAEDAVRQFLMLLREFGSSQLEQIRGMTERDISTLERDIDRPFCTGHRAFLSAFGATPRGAFRPALYDYKFDERIIRDYYRMFPDENCPGWVYWADGGGGHPVHYHVFANDPSVEDPGVGSPVLNCLFYESMWTDLIFDAYLFLIEDQFEATGLSGWLWGGSEIGLADAPEPYTTIQRVLDQLGFEPWIELARFQCLMRRQNTFVWAGRSGTAPGPDEWNYSLSGPDSRELRELNEILADNVGAVKRPVRE